MMQHAISVNGRNYTSILPLEEELQFSAQKNYCFDLSYLALLNFHGEKASDFLQGQLSADLREVNTEQIRQAVFCNLQGRLLALIDIIQWNSLGLILPQDLVEMSKENLSKAAAFSKVHIEPEACNILGLYLQNNSDIVPAEIKFPNEKLKCCSNKDYFCYALGNGFYVLICKKDTAESLLDLFQSKQQLRGSLAWHYLRLQQHSLEIYPASRGLFLAHRLDLHLTGHLNFNKGCYKGQEIIARMHYRAKTKHSMKLFKIGKVAEIQSGMRIYNQEEQEVGELVDYCPLSSNAYLIAVSILIEKPEFISLEQQAVQPICV